MRGAHMDAADERENGHESQGAWDQVLSMIESPAAVVHRGIGVRACNDAWRHVIATDGGSSDGGEAALGSRTNLDALLEDLRRRDRASGRVVMELKAGEDGEGSVCGEIRASWRSLGAIGLDESLALVVLDGVGDKVVGDAVDQSLIEQVLVSRTVIEEAERLRIGQALHDVVVQNLTVVRASLGALIKDDVRLGEVVGKLDGVVEEIRTLSFELSPPVLEDLGLLAALHWLVESLSRRHGIEVEMVDDGSEPALSKTAQRIVFRAVGELVTNAIRHAPGSEIVVSCVSDREMTRVVVRDTGPGMSARTLRETLRGRRGFGLFSVKHQLQGIGGVFELSSGVGEGVRATILMGASGREEGSP